LDFERIVITGDLAFRKPSESIYNWIKNKLEKKNYNYLIIPGNHDDPDLISRVFGLKLNNEQLYYYIIQKRYLIFFLDTSDSTVSKKQIAFINKVSNKNKDKEIIIFMHHPPVNTGCIYMDRKYPLMNMNEFQKVMEEIDRLTHIFCGHQHCSRNIQYGDIEIFITPSTFFQIDCSLESFRVESYNIGYRIIEFDNKYVDTRLNYLEMGENGK